MFLGLEKGHELGHMDTYIIQKVLIYDLFPICIIKIRNWEMVCGILITYDVPLPTPKDIWLR